MAEETKVEEKEQVSIDTLPMKEFEAARGKGVTTIDKPEEKPAEQKAGEEEKSKVTGGFQKRIDRLTKHNAALETDLEAAKKKLQELEAKAGGKTEEAAPSGDPEPKQDDFKTIEEWVKAQARWEVRQELKAEREAEEKEAEEALRKETFDAYNKRVSEAQAKYDDWKEVVGQAIDLPAGVGPAIIEMENGPDVAYHLGKHPEICEELLKMGSLKAIGKVWRISEELLGAKESEELEEKEAKPASKAPAPIKPVGGGSTKSSVALDKMPMRDYNKAREAGRTN